MTENFKNKFIYRSHYLQFIPIRENSSDEKICKVGGMIPDEITEQASSINNDNLIPNYFLSIKKSVFHEDDQDLISLFYFLEDGFEFTWLLLEHTKISDKYWDTGTFLTTKTVQKTNPCNKSLLPSISKIGGNPRYIQGEMHTNDFKVVTDNNLSFVFQIDVEDVGKFHPKGSSALFDGCLYVFANVNEKINRITFSKYYTFLQFP